MYDPSIEILFKKRQQMKVKLEQTIASMNEQISLIDAAIEQLSGKKVWQVEEDMKYDDENPDYIKGSIED